MATYRKRGGGVQAVIRIVGHDPESRMFATRTQARMWAEQREEDLRLGRLAPHSATVGDALRRYANDVSPKRRGARWERLRLRAIREHWDKAKLPVAALTSAHVAAWRDGRLKEVAPGTVAREMNLLSAVFTHAVREWRWIPSNPCLTVTKPAEPPPRRRRITDAEVTKICLALGYECGRPANMSQRVAVAFLFALETAMRAGEIVGMRQKDLHLAEQYVELPRTKNGDRREVPLSKRAVELIGLLPESDPVFGLESGTRDALYRKAKQRAKTDVRFHDARAEAIWRLSKKLDVLQLARMIGHRDVNSLRFYYAEHASETAKRLG